MTIVLLATTLAFVVYKLPKGYSDDLTQIGNGNNILVYVHDKNSATSLQLLSLLDAVRSEYGDRVEFLLADMGEPSGREFAQQNGVAATDVLLYSPDGKRLEALHGVQNVAALRMAIEEGFQLMK